MPALASEVEPVTSLLDRGEELLSPAAAAKASKLPGHRGGPHVNAATVFRWITRGVRTSRGEVIRLEAARIGTAWKTSLPAISRFVAKLTDAALPNDAPSASAPTTKQRARTAKAATKRADEIFGK